MIGIEFMQYGNYYLAAAEQLDDIESDTWFNPLPYQLLSQSLELHLKSFIWLRDKSSRKTIKNKYGHDLAKLWRHSRDHNIAEYCSVTPLRNETIALLSPYYKTQQEGSCNEPPDLLISCYNSLDCHHRSEGSGYEPVLDGAGA